MCKPGQDILISFKQGLKGVDKKLKSGIGRFIRVNTSITATWVDNYVNDFNILLLKVKGVKTPLANNYSLVRLVVPNTEELISWPLKGL